MMASKSSTPVVTRGRKGSQKEGVSTGITLDEFSVLLRETEERLKKCFKDEISVLSERLVDVEKALSSVQIECARLDVENARMKEVILNQQMQLENHESKLRERNLLVNNVPEDNLSFGTETLESDSDKISFIITSAQVDADIDDVIDFQRLGKRTPNKHRPLRITLADKKVKFAFLNMRKSISMNKDLQQAFHNRVFINSDNSFLRQKEDYRLRERLRELKNDYPNSRSYIRAGALYQNGSIIDKVDVRNQIF